MQGIIIYAWSNNSLQSPPLYLLMINLLRDILPVESQVIASAISGFGLFLILARGGYSSKSSSLSSSKYLDFQKWSSLKFRGVLLSNTLKEVQSLRCSSRTG